MAVLSLKSLSDKIGAAALRTTAPTLIGAINEVDIDLDAAKLTLSGHVSSSSNPHSVTKSQVGLGNVDNTSDANKPVSSAMATALGLKLASADFTAANVLSRLLTVDGHTSGIEADLLDGYHGSSYLRVGATTNGQTVTLFGGATAPKLYLQANDGVSGASLSFMNDEGVVKAKVERRDGTNDKRILFENNSGYNFSFWDDGKLTRYTPAGGAQDVVDLGMYKTTKNYENKFENFVSKEYLGLIHESNITLPNGWSMKQGFVWVDANSYGYAYFDTGFANECVFAMASNLHDPSQGVWGNCYCYGSTKTALTVGNVTNAATYASWMAIGY